MVTFKLPGMARPTVLRQANRSKRRARRIFREEAARCEREGASAFAKVLRKKARNG